MIQTTTSNRKTKEYSKLAELISKSKYTILYFYPKDNTPGCTLEAQDFAHLQKTFSKLWCQIVWVSKDSIESHCAFSEKYWLEFQLISDPKAELHTQFGVLGEKSMFGKKYIGTIRSTFLLNNKGDVIHEWRRVSASNHAKKVLEKVQEVVTLHKS